jgi:hypothetical protein
METIRQFKKRYGIQDEIEIDEAVFRTVFKMTADLINEENHQKSLKLSQYAVETPIFAQVVEVATSSQKQAVSAQKTVIKGSFVASKSGKAYHLPWCSGAKRIKEENKIWFQTKEEAEKAGYHPAGNCEGL